VGADPVSIAGSSTPTEDAQLLMGMIPTIERDESPRSSISGHRNIGQARPYRRWTSKDDASSGLSHTPEPVRAQSFSSSFSRLGIMMDNNGARDEPITSAEQFSADGAEMFLGDTCPVEPEDAQKANETDDLWGQFLHQLELPPQDHDFFSSFGYREDYA
jgi:hypothetical protein